MAPLPDFVPDSAVQATPSMPDFVPDSAVSEEPSKWAQLGRIETGLGLNTLNMLTLGFGDEASSGINALIDRGWYGTPVSQAYDQRLEQARALRQEFRDTAGPEKYVADVAAGAALPIPGAWWKAAPIKTGMALGAAYGAGEGKGGTGRAIGAGTGAGVGALGSLAVKGVGKLANAALTSDIGVRAKEILADMLTGPNGVFGPQGEAGKFAGSAGAPATAAPKLSPTELALLQRTKGIEPAQLTVAKNALAGAQSEGVPMTLTEALADPSVTRQSRFLANYEPTMTPIGKFIEARSEGAPARISSITDAIAPEQSSYNGGMSLVQGAQKVDSALRAARREVTAPIYREAFDATPTLESPEVARLMEHPDIAPSVKDAQKVIAIRHGVSVEEVPANSTEVANEVLAELSSKGKAAKWQVGDKASYNLEEAKGALETAIYKEAPGLKAARDTYASISKQLKANTGADSIAMLKDLEIGQLEGAGKKLMDIPAAELEKIRNTFDKAGAGDALKDGVRAYFTKVIESQSGEFSNNKDLVAKILGNTQTVGRLRAVLGSEEAEKIIEKLARERAMFKGAQALHPGSSTAGNLAEEAAFTKQQSLLGKALNVALHPKVSAERAIEYMTMKPADEQLARELAQVYVTDPRRGLLELQNIMSIQASRYPYVSSVNDLVGALTTPLQSGGAGALSTSLTPRGK